MFSGFGIVQESCDSRVDDIELPRMLGALDVIRASVAGAANSALSHEEFVAKFCPAPSR